VDTRIIEEVERLSAEAPDILAEIESAIDEEATFEEKEKAKSLAAAFIARYDVLLRPLGSAEQKEVLRSLGPKVGAIEEKLTELRQAPE
jgi:hypothetical protein